MEMNEKQLKMVNDALATHIDRLEKMRFNAEEQSVKCRLFTAIEEFRALKSDIELLLLRY